MNPLVIVNPVKASIYLDSVSAFGYNHEFFKPEKAEVKRVIENNKVFYSLTFKPLGISEYSDSIQECVENLSLSIYWLWDGYVVDACPCPDRDSIGIKSRLRKLISKRTKERD